jgi:hypothetical protein
MLHILSTDSKRAIVHQRALQLVSDRDLEVLEEIATIEAADGPASHSPERASVTARFDEAFWTAMGSTNFRFTVPEMDQLLAGPDESKKKVPPDIGGYHRPIWFSFEMIRLEIIACLLSKPK